MANNDDKTTANAMQTVQTKAATPIIFTETIPVNRIFTVKNSNGVTEYLFKVTVKNEATTAGRRGWGAFDLFLGTPTGTNGAFVRLPDGTNLDFDFPVPPGIQPVPLATDTNPNFDVAIDAKLQTHLMWKVVGVGGLDIPYGIVRDNSVTFQFPIDIPDLNSNIPSGIGIV